MLGGSITRLGCVFALALAALIAPAYAHAGGHSAAPHSGRRGVQVKGQKAQRISPFTEAASSAADIPGKLVNHGGPVMASNTVHAIYWFPSGYTLDSTWRGVVDGYLGNVAADSGETSNVFSVTSQYGASYNAQFAGSAVDTTPFPASGCSSGVGGKPCLTEEQVFNELSAFAKTQSWSGDPNAVSGSSPQPSSHPTHLFIVYLPPGVADCFDATQGICSANSSASYYCAYHTAWYDNTQTFVWANMPWSWNNSGCQGPKAPNGAAADSAVDTTSHEYIEALTDPYLNAWFDDGGYEIADKCQTTYGSALETSSGNYNQLINGSHYWTELEYSNKLGDCYQLGAPVISTLEPTAAVSGQTIAITGQNFFGPVVVRFHGLVAPVVSVTPTQVTVRVPSGDYYGKVTVQAIGGTGTSAASFGYPKPQIASVAPLDGKIGTTVTLTGANFTGVTGVKFATIPTTYSVVGDATLTVQVPDKFSSGRISLESPGGTVVSSLYFRVTKVTAFTPSSAKAGALVTITGQGLASTTTVDFPNHDGVAVTKATGASVQVVVPADATGPGPLVVHTPNIDAAGIATKSFKATPTIASFTPDGQAGSAVVITGANLGDATAVKFSSVSVSFDSPSATSITAYAPANLSSGRVTVVTPHGNVVTSTAFAITKVTGFSPASAAAGAVVTISGRGLKSATSVDFGSATVAVTSTTATAVKVRVPDGASTGNLTVHTPNIDGAGLSTAKQFKPLPRITSFDASGYQVGDTVTAHGTNLTESGTYTARIGSVAVTSLVVQDAGTLTFQVPSGAATGALAFANAAGSTTSSARVSIRATIAGFAPGDTTTGKKVTLTGATFTGTTSVTFGGAKASSFSVGSGGMTLAVTVPAGAVDGSIAVTNAGGSTVSASTFHVDPVISKFSPASGAVGATVTITGTGLENVASVDFGGGVSAAPLSTAPTSLKVVVPAGATSGPIAVHTGLSAASARSPFDVTFSVTSVSQPFGAPGATITFSGVGLTGITSVKFGSVPATISSQSGSSLSVIVPAIADDSTVSVTKGSTTIQAPSKFGLFVVTSATPQAVTAGGTIHVQGSHLDGSTAKFAGVDTPVALSSDGTATVPDGFTGGSVTIADAYGDAMDETYELFAVASYSAAHAAPGDSISIELTAGDYSATSVDVRFPGAGVVAATGGDGTVQVDVPPGATSGALEVEAGGTSGWATGGVFTVDRASVVLNAVRPTDAGAEVELLATSDGGLGDTTVTWRQGGDTYSVDLPVQTVQAGDLVVVQTAIADGDVTIEVGTPLAAEDGLALGTAPDTDWLVADGVWASAGSVDWGGLAVARTGSATPDDVTNWSPAN